MSKNHQPDDKLPEVVAGLEMLTVTNGLSSPQNSAKRILRKRVPKPEAPSPEVVILNRRCCRRPKKRTFSEMENEDDIKVYYLDKSVKRSPHTLETIFEEDEKINIDAAPQMSKKRFKRMINFQVMSSDVKQKKRRLKIKKIFGSKVFRANGVKRQLGMLDVLNKLELIRSSSPVNAENEK